MADRRYRLLVLATHPVQYASPVFQAMAAHARLDLQVAYCSLQGAESARDPEFGVEVKWDVPLLEGYPWMEVRNRSPRPGLLRFFGLMNTGLWRLIRKGGFDGVVALTGYAYASFWIAVMACKSRGIPFLFTTDATSYLGREVSSWKRIVKPLALPRIYGVADLVVVTSTAGHEFLEKLGFPSSRIVDQSVVVDNDWWIERAAKVDRASVRASWNVPKDARVALFCAKFQPWKRPADVVRAFAKANVPNSYLVLAGDGPLRASLEEEARTLGIAERVRFLGFVNQTRLPGVYASADLYVLPSQWEGCPASVGESMLCKTPPVISDEVRGRFDVVKHGVTGYIYPVGDITALADILRDVLSDVALLERLRGAARAMIETTSPARNAESFVEAMDRIYLKPQTNP